MVRGLDIFKHYFKDFSAQYIIIGGTACDIIINEINLNPRAKKDIDIILIVEALNRNFIIQFWKFILDGNYRKKEKSSEDKIYYRFRNPENENFPLQIELFSRKPEIIELSQGIHLTPIPVDEDLSSLSAILLNEDYYRFVISHSILSSGLHYANSEALICLKVKAFLEMKFRYDAGEKIDSKNIKKHKSDIFRLVPMLIETNDYEIPHSIKSDLQEFTNIVAHDLPDNSIFKAMGLQDSTVENEFLRLIRIFRLQ